MPTTVTDRRILLTCAAFVTTGLTLITLGLLLEPPLALLRRLT